MIPNDGLIPNMPSPEDRARAVHTALKNSSWASAAVVGEKLSDEDKARIRLEEKFKTIFDTCLTIKIAEEEKTGQPFSEDGMNHMIMELFKGFFANETPDALRFMLGMVHSGLLIEALREC